MKKTSVLNILSCVALLASAAPNTLAHPVSDQTGDAAPAAFDIIQARITAADRWLNFSMQLSAEAGTVKPTATGKFAGSNVFAYVWPTRLDSSSVGFDADQGILALAVTAHPDFEDTPLYDENGDGDLDNDGNVWHSHWVVLTPDDACGDGALKVRDIPEGATPKLPPTWPGVPLLIDSPGYSPVLNGATVTVRVPFVNAVELKGVAFDGVTAGLRISHNLHDPLLCVVNVMDIASDDLSLPGHITTQEK